MTARVDSRSMNNSASNGSTRGLVAFAVVYAVVALLVGGVVAATFSLACEGRGFCADLDRTGGYGMLVAVPPLVIAALAVVAYKLGLRWILHAGFAVVIVIVPAFTLAVAAIVGE